MPGGRYRIIEATGTVVPGGGDTGNHCDDCYTPFVFPFPVRLYENTYTQAQIGSNGVLVFGTPPIQFTDVPCIPAPGATYTSLPILERPAHRHDRLRGLHGRARLPAQSDSHY